MKIAFTSEGKSWKSKVDPRFGRAEYIVVYDEEKDEMTAVDNRVVTGMEHGAGTATAQRVFEMKPDVLITGNGPGQNASFILDRMEMDIYINAHRYTIEEAYSRYKENRLDKLSFSEK
jgi:predicted Fe-Mo cluster-binding NifX family protein